MCVCVGRREKILPGIAKVKERIAKVRECEKRYYQG